MASPSKNEPGGKFPPDLFSVEGPVEGSSNS